METRPTITAMRHVTPCLALALSACASEPGTAPVGSLDNPVLCDGKRGGLEYLGRLRCPSGAAPHVHYRRYGPRGGHGNDTEEFRVRCLYDARSATIYIDRHYTGHVDTRAVPGFDLVDAPPVRSR